MFNLVCVSVCVCLASFEYLNQSFVVVPVLVTLYETTDKPSDALEYPSVENLISENVKDSYTFFKAPTLYSSVALQPPT